MGKFRDMYKQIEKAHDPALVVEGCLDDDPAARAKALQAMEAGMSATQTMVYSGVSLGGIEKLYKQAVEVLPKVANMVRNGFKNEDIDRMLADEAPLISREPFVDLLTKDQAPIKLDAGLPKIEDLPLEDPKEGLPGKVEPEDGG